MNNPEYLRGVADGEADARILLLPRGEGLHTFAAWERINAKYRGALYLPKGAYSYGYADGFDRVAEEAGYTGLECDEDNL